MEKWSILSDVVKYVQYIQYPIGYYELEVKAPVEKSGTKMYKKSYRIVKEGSKEISFESNIEHLKQDYLDTFQGINSDVIIQLNMIKVVI